MDQPEDWVSNNELILQPSGNLLFPVDGEEGGLLPQIEGGNPFARDSYEPPSKTQAVAINTQSSPKPLKSMPNNNLTQVKNEKKPEIEVLHEDYLPYPQYWIKKKHTSSICSFTPK